MSENHPDMRFKLEVNKRCHECDVSPDDFMALFERGIKLLELDGRDGTLKVFFVSDEEIRQLNRNYRDQDKPTDVISLSYYEESPFPGDNLIGEIFISVDTTRRQAEEHDLTVKEEAQFLFVHGLLHIFGYDHKEDKDRTEMFDLQDKILQNKKIRATIEG